MNERVANGDDRVYDEIRRAIIEGRYPPGARLVEQRLGEEFDVSRTPVREVLRRLEAEGLVVVERNRGAEVRRYSPSEIGDLYEVRARLEAYAAELAAQRRSPEDLARLDAGVVDFDRAAADAAASRDGAPSVDTVRHLASANAAIHGALLDAARHPRIHQLVAGSVDTPLVFQALRHFGADEVSRSALFHRLIAAAVADQEPERAGRLMVEHVLQGRDAILARLGDDGTAERLAVGAP